MPSKQETDRFREACEIVHATANGETYGLTVDEQLEALRLASVHCSEALGLTPYTAPSGV